MLKDIVIVVLLLPTMLYLTRFITILVGFMYYSSLEDEERSSKDVVWKNIKSLIISTVMLVLFVSVFVFADRQDDRNMVAKLSERPLVYDHLAVVRHAMGDGVITDREEESFKYFEEDRDVPYRAVLDLVKDEGYGNSSKVDDLYDSLVDEITGTIRTLSDVLENDEYKESERVAKIAAAFEDGTFDANEIQLFKTEKKRHGLHLTNMEMLSILADVENEVADGGNRESEYEKLVDGILESHNFLGGE